MKESTLFIILGIGFELEDALFLNWGYQAFGIILGCLGFFYIILGFWQMKFEEKEDRKYDKRRDSDGKRLNL